MMNKAMERKLAAGEALDVRALASKIELALDGKAKLYTLQRGAFKDDKDYCDAEEESWIWSIGQSLVDGVVRASTDGRYYQHPDYTCLWLR